MDEHVLSTMIVTTPDKRTLQKFKQKTYSEKTVALSYVRAYLIKTLRKLIIASDDGINKRYTNEISKEVFSIFKTCF